MEFSIPQYLHKSILVLWFETDELVTVIIGFLVGFFLNGWWWLSLFAVPYIYIRLKRNNPRGYLLHLQYRLGLLTFNGYPHFYQNKFHQ